MTKLRRKKGRIVRSTYSAISVSILSVLILFTFSTIASAQSSGKLTPNPWKVGFGDAIIVGSTQSRTETLKNSGNSKLTIIGLNVTGGAFSASGWTLPLTLAPGQSKAGTVKFAPTLSGKQTGTLAVSWTSNNSSHVTKIWMVGTASSSGQLAANPTSMNFGSVQVGSSKPWAGTLTNSASSAITISKASLTGTGYQLSGLTLPATLNPGQSTSYVVTFAPKSAGTFGGNVAITSNATNSTLNVALSGTSTTGSQLTANPTSLSFGSVQTGTKKTFAETLTNSSATAITVSQVGATGSGFSLSGINPPVTLSPNQSFTLSVTFAPSSTGTSNGTLSITSNAANSSLSIPLTGSGTTVTAGQLAVSPGSINFGNVTVGSSQKQTATLSASNGSVTVTSAGITTGTPFSVSGISFPITLASGQTASFGITFAPQASGSTSASLAFFSNASNGSVSESLAGAGVPTVQHSVTLTWNPSSSSNVVGYNIYRSGQSGGPYAKINPALDPSTTDVDNSVQSGSTYYYVVTAVDSSGKESLFSNQTTAVIP
jgi:Cep192 domain 4/HYDIN/CFA65/VesB-like, Ig-like domain